MSEYKDWRNWVKTVAIAAVGGGVAGSVAALSDPAKYVFPRDLGTGKMWPFFLSGAGVAVGALLLKSPFGTKVMSAVKESQTQLAESKQAIEQAKSDLKKK